MNRYNYKILFLILFAAIGWQPAVAQLYPTQYRPANVNWQELSTRHFSIVFPMGQDSVAWKTARILEYQYPKAQKLTGGQLNSFPVILTDYNDRSNGIVSSLPFRSEIDISPIKGKALNPETGGWLKNVVPHELVHAMQFNNLDGIGLGQFVNIFSPDLARSLYGAIPSGLLEGLATYHESHSVTPGGGRGNYPWFYNQFNSAFTSSARWSMGQMVHFPVYTRPLNRFYIGGYEFTRWLQDNYGYNTSRDATDFYIRWPFLGYGIALFHATGQWPGQLYDEFERFHENELADVKSENLTPLPIQYKGAEIRRPKWLSDSTLIFHGAFYNSRPGFYRYNVESESMERIITTRSVGDFNYTLSKDKSKLAFSYYRPDPIYDGVFKAELVKANLITGATQRITKNGRVWAPAFLNDSTLLALQTEHSWSQLVKISTQKNSDIEPLLTLPPHQIISFAMHPRNDDSLAVVINKNGVQGLWLASRSHLHNDLTSQPAIAFKNGSVFDPAWHPDGDRLLFTADFTGVMQVYEFNLQTDQITQVTNVPYNAFEASYNSDGDRIAFALQQVNEQLPAVLSRNNFYGKMISSDMGDYQLNLSIEETKEIDTVRDSTWHQTAYSAGLSWLKPRTVLPIIEEVGISDSYQLGLGFHSSDLLQQQAYSLGIIYFEERLWYDLTYQNKQFFPGFEASIYSQPSLITLGLIAEGDTLAQSFVFQERSFALSIPMQFTLHQNVFFTGLFIEPELRQSQIRFFDENGARRSDFANATIGNLFGQFNYRLQQNIRDMQPNSGLVLYGELEHYFTFGDLTVNTNGGNASLDFDTPTALRGGLFTYFAPLHQWNQSLRLGLEAITQTSRLVSYESIISEGFSRRPFPFANNLVSFSTRYTIPLFYPDNGGLLIPLYLSSVYLVAFTNTVTDPTASNLLESSRSVFGGGIRFRFRISNLSLDIGIGIGYEPTRNNTNIFIGNF